MPTILPGNRVLISHLADWSELPNGSRGWETAVEPGLTGAEDREGLRQTGLRSISWLIAPHSQEENERLHAEVRAALKLGRAAVPWWGRGYKIGAAGVGPSDTSIPISGIIPADWLPAAGDLLFASDLWGPIGAATWQVWTVASVTPGTGGAEHVIVITAAAGLTINGGDTAAWRLLYGRLTSGEIPWERPTQARYKLTLEQPEGANPGISNSDPLLRFYAGRKGEDNLGSGLSGFGLYLNPIIALLDGKTNPAGLLETDTQSSIVRLGGYLCEAFGTGPISTGPNLIVHNSGSNPATLNHDAGQYDPTIGLLVGVKITTVLNVISEGAVYNLDTVDRTLTGGSVGNCSVEDSASRSMGVISDLTFTRSGLIAPSSPPTGGLLWGAPGNAVQATTVVDLSAANGAIFSQWIGTGFVTLTLIKIQSGVATTDSSNPLLINSIISSFTNMNVDVRFIHRPFSGIWWLFIPSTSGWNPNSFRWAHDNSDFDMCSEDDLPDMSLPTGEIGGFGYYILSDDEGEWWAFRSRNELLMGEGGAINVL